MVSLKKTFTLLSTGHDVAQSCPPLSPMSHVSLSGSTDNTQYSGTAASFRDVMGTWTVHVPEYFGPLEAT